MPNSYASPQHVHNGLPLFGPHTRDVYTLLHKAVPLLHANQQQNTRTMVVIKRVTAWPEDQHTQRSITAKMKRQSKHASEVDGWHNVAGVKCVIWGTYVPDIDHHGNAPRSGVSDDVEIDPALGLTLEQFRQWWAHHNRAKAAVCEAKLLIDTLLDKGERLTFRVPWLDMATGVVVDVFRDQINPEFAINAYLLVEDDDTYWSGRVNDVACPLRWQEARDLSAFLAQDILTLGIAMPDGTTTQISLDPTFRQIQGKCFEDLRGCEVWPMKGPGLDREYINIHAATPCPCHRLIDEERFTSTDIRLYLSRVEPVSQPFESVYRSLSLVMGLLSVIAQFTGEFVVDQLFDVVGSYGNDQPEPPVSGEPRMSNEERLRRAAYEANLAAQRAEERAVEAVRKARAAEERAKRAAQGEKPFTQTLPQLGKAKAKGRQRTVEEELVHSVHVSPEQKEIRSVAFDAREAATQAGAASRRIRKKAEGLKQLLSEMGKAEAAATHVVPRGPTLDDHLAQAMVLA